MIIKIQTVECQRCGHRWTPRKSDVRLCPKCHSPLWDKPRGKARQGLVRPGWARQEQGKGGGQVADRQRQR